MLLRQTINSLAIQGRLGVAKSTLRRLFATPGEFWCLMRIVCYAKGVQNHLEVAKAKISPVTNFVANLISLLLFFVFSEVIP